MCARPGSVAAVQRAARIAGPEATVRAIEVLVGGTHARTWLIETANPRLEVVLREFPAGDDAPRREARVLTALDGLDGLAPRLLAVGQDGAPSGASWVLISRLNGAADLAACGVLHHRPGMAALHPVLLDDRGTARYESVDGRRVEVYQVNVDAVFGLLRLRHLAELPGWLAPVCIASADGGPHLAAALIQRAAERRRPEGSHLQYVVTVEGDIADPGGHRILHGARQKITVPGAAARECGFWGILPRVQPSLIMPNASCAIGGSAEAR
jgi:hypothetical protein